MEIADRDLQILISGLLTTAAGSDVEGLSPALAAVVAHRAKIAGSFDRLVAQLTPSLLELDPIPHAMIAQAKRRAALRTELLASGAFTYKALAEGRNTSQPTIRQWVRRARERHELFTVDHDNETLVPAFLLDEDLNPHPELHSVISTLVDAGEDGWGLWAWFTHPSTWLDGKVPLDEARSATCAPTQ